MQVCGLRTATAHRDAAGGEPVGQVPGGGGVGGQLVFAHSAPFMVRIPSDR
jgi:hypothetical protein